MPSWNIHTAHVEHLLGIRDPETLGILDGNAFLFGNYVPDVYVGYMVPDATYRIDYRITHVARGHLVPIPDADRFWDAYMVQRRPVDPAGLSLLVGAWAHLATDCTYNERFRLYCDEQGIAVDDALRIRKQSDFDLFGRSLGISQHVVADAELCAAAQAFGPYSILKADVERTKAVADNVIAGVVDWKAAAPQGAISYQELDAAWLSRTFEACNRFLEIWLAAWRKLEAGMEEGLHPAAADVRAAAGLPAPRSWE